MKQLWATWIICCAACQGPVAPTSPPIDMAPLQDAYNNPTGLLAASDMPGLLLTLQDLLGVARTLSRAETLPGLMADLQQAVSQHFVAAPGDDDNAGDAPFEVGGYALRGQLFVSLQRACDRAPEAGTGLAHLFANITHDRIEPVLWSTFADCYFEVPAIEGIETPNISVNGHIYILALEPLLHQEDPSPPDRFLARFEAEARIGDFVDVGAFDFRKPTAERLEIRLSLDTGSVIFFEEALRVGFRGQRGTWECNFEARTCTLTGESEEALAW